MPDEILAIVLVSIAAGTGLSFMRMILAHRSGQQDRSSSSADSSLTTSELERMMKRSVESVVAPLADKIENLELQLSRQNRALEAPKNDLLIEMDDISEEESVPASSRLRAKS